MTLRCVLVFGVLVASCRCQQGAVATPEVAALRLSPGSLDFGRVWVGVEATAPLVVQNPARLEQPVALVVSRGFTLDGFPTTLGPGDEVTGRVVFTALGPGLVEGSVQLGAEVVALRAMAEAIPSCAARDACHVARFDTERGACVETEAPDETECTASFACFVEARCRAGQCIGLLTTCDDGNLCTRDACGAAGCVHLDDSLSCPLPANPCLAPACDRQRGCTSVEVEDGTPCGSRTCDTAAICLSGQCQRRPAPQTQSCTTVMAGVPAGPGFVDGLANDARFDRVTSMVYLPTGDLVLAEGDGTLSAGRLRRVSPDGATRTLAGGQPGSADGFGARARFGPVPQILGLDPRGNLLIRDGVPGAGLKRSLRRMSPSGLVVTECLQCLGGDDTSLGKNRRGELVMVDRGPLAPVTVSYRSDDGQTRVRTADGLVLTGIWMVSAEPLTLCASIGALATIPQTLVHLEEGPGQTLTWTRGAPCSLRLGAKLLPDGGSLVLAPAGPTDDGPVGSVGLEEAGFGEFASDADGGLAIYDRLRFHVRRVEGGFMRTLAGPVPRRGTTDGARSLLLTSPRAVAASPSGVWFTDEDRLRRLDGTGVTTVVADAGSVGRDLAWSGTSVVWLGGVASEFLGQTFFAAVDQLTVFAPTGALESSRTTPRKDLTSVAWSTSGLLVAHLDAGLEGALDAGYDPFFSALRVRSGSGAPRAYVTVQFGSGPRRTTELFDINPGEDWNKPFLQRDAGQPSLTDFYELRPGVLIGLSGRAVVRRDVASRQETTVAELSELPSAIAPGLDGGASVAVPHAILHVRF